MKETIKHGATATRIIKRDGERMKVKVKAQLYSLGNQAPYFSVTADLYEQIRQGRGFREAGGGCCHDEILQAFPELAPVVSLHLSNEDGAPMHDIENAWFHAGGCGRIENAWFHAGGCGRSETTAAGLAQDQIRRAIERAGGTPEQAAAAIKAAGLADQPATVWKRWENTPNADHLASHLRIEPAIAAQLCAEVVAGTLDKAGLSAFIDQQRPRWKLEAAEAVRAILALKASESARKELEAAKA